MVLDITVPTGRTPRPKQQKGTQWLTANLNLTENLKRISPQMPLLTKRTPQKPLVVGLDFNVLSFSLQTLSPARWLNSNL